MNRPSSCALLLVLLAALPCAAAGGIWRDVAGKTNASKHRTLALDLAGARGLLAKAPLERTRGKSAVVITLPMPDGSFARFRVEESPVMASDLAAQLPEVKTYRVTGIDDPLATGRLDITPAGFHGFVLTAGGTVYIDPQHKGDTEHYITYWRHDYSGSEANKPFSCGYNNTSARIRAKSARRSERADFASGATLRTYRLAMAASGEYTQFHGGTVAGAQAAMVTTVNRVTGIFEKELAIRLTMVNNTAITFTNPATDPYANDDPDVDITANQVVIDSLIGSANYDIGHVVTTQGGGLAYLGVVCEPGFKAGGVTGKSSPAGDAFDVDYVAHEMGHQFGASHTFNGTTENCGHFNRDFYAAYEPGSGSTIMAYAGICGVENLQPHSDAYFHGYSFDEILDYVTSAGCAVETSTGNQPPVASAGAPITIPMSTPFYLTGSGTDPDGNALTFGWEQFDTGAASPPNTDDGTRPIFRSFNPVATPVRVFPRMADVISGLPTIGESMPSTLRNLHFRLTARDNITGVGNATVVVSVTNAAGPFVVTAPNSALTWNAGRTQAVTWNVASTNAPPVNCANVKILMSLDGGHTYPMMFHASTPNDGTQSITVPNIGTSTARMRVECVSTPFFDISNANFKIVPTLAVAAAATSTSNVAVTWNAIPEAVNYKVYRRAAGQAFTLIGTSATTGFDDDTVVASTAYLYAVEWLDGSAVAAPMSAPDLATTVIFTNATLTPALSLVRGVDITELRTAVDAVRLLAGVGAYPYTDTITPFVTNARVIHTAELRLALNQARSVLALPAATFTDPDLIAQTTAIRAVHVDDLRNGVR